MEVGGSGSMGKGRMGKWADAKTVTPVSQSKRV